jgi:hypothetical protein
MESAKRSSTRRWTKLPIGKCGLWCWNLFPWARLRRVNGAIKVPPLLDQAGHLPPFVVLTEGKLSRSRARCMVSSEQG